MGYCSITYAPDSTNIGKSSVPKAVLKSDGECDSIQKSLWILCKKFKFSTTSSFQIECFKNLQKAITILRNMKFPLIISVMGTHVVVVRGSSGSSPARFFFLLKILAGMLYLKDQNFGWSYGQTALPKSRLANF